MGIEEKQIVLTKTITKRVGHIFFFSFSFYSVPYSQQPVSNLPTASEGDAPLEAVRRMEWNGMEWVEEGTSRGKEEQRVQRKS